LTPPETIARRREHACAADFTVALYNPRSKRRRDNLGDALAVAKRHRSPKTPVGHVRNAYRPDQSVSLATLETFDPGDADMFSIILVGGSATTFLPAPDGTTEWTRGARMYTPRGYGGKYVLG
ncbi:MAG: precorrin-3B C(17)-methyltransferase, partial [Deltaproteobacteria bacterium]|nr:precorrin-3B C(17)-methyltransferase [Deltaproteobacteria bacterium]